MPEVYDLLLDGIEIDDQDDAWSPLEPTPIELDRVEVDPRKITLACACGAQAIYRLRAAKRLAGVCSSSKCLRSALDQAERWARLAKAKGWEMIAETDVLDPPRPRLTAREEIALYQKRAGIRPEDGELGPETILHLRANGRGGMITVWQARLAEEAGPDWRIGLEAEEP